MSSLDYRTNEAVVAFIDILGSSKAIETDAEGSLNIVHKAYDDSLSLFKNLFGESYFEPSVKIFSDNIVVAVSYGDKRVKMSAFLAVAMMSAIIQVEFLKKGWLTRGGISSGSFFADEVMVWGTALIKAYKLESTVAVYPRVVIDSSLIGELKLAFAKTDTHCKTWIRQDKDRLFYIEFINKCLKNAELFAIGLFDVIETKIAENHRKRRVALQGFLGEKPQEELLEKGEKANA